MHHLSWSHVLSAAVVQKEHRGVADPDQAWILGELIRYLEHPRSGALEFDDMSAAWAPVREAVAAGTLRQTDKTAPEVAARFDALLRYCSLQLGRRLGDEVTPSISRKELADPALRISALVSRLASERVLGGAIRIPNTAGLLVVTADLRANQITCYVDIDAPHEGRPATRLNWLIRQLRSAPDSLRVEAFAMHSRGAGTAELLKDIRESPAILIADPTKELLRMFRVALSTPMGAKRGRGHGSFIDSLAEAINSFYSEVMQNLKAWTATPPKMRELPPMPEERPSLALRPSPRRTEWRCLIRSNLQPPLGWSSKPRGRSWGTPPLRWLPSPTGLSTSPFRRRPAVPRRHGAGGDDLPRS